MVLLAVIWTQTQPQAIIQIADFYDSKQYYIFSFTQSINFSPI